MPYFGMNMAMGDAERMRLSSAASFLPGGIAQPDLILWLAAWQLSSLTFNGSDISGWADLSGAGNNASQGTAANQPAYAATGFNGRPAIRFTSADSNFMRANGVAASLTGNDKPFTAVYLLKLASVPSVVSTAMTPHSLGRAADGITLHQQQLPFNSAGVQAFRAIRRGDSSDLAQQIVASGSVVDTLYSVTERYTGTAITTTINGTTIHNAAALNTSSCTFDLYGIGASVTIASASSYLDGWIPEHALWKTALSAADVRRVENSMRARAGMTLL